MTDDGAFRNNDPSTSRAAARSINAALIRRRIMALLAAQTSPLNGFEISAALGLPTITVVPRLAPLRREGLIATAGTRPGPSGREQIAYVATTLGRAPGAGTAPVSPASPRRDPVAVARTLATALAALTEQARLSMVGGHGHLIDNAADALATARAAGIEPRP
jgi:predicted ArsR family transcriptional regulator